MCNIIWKIVVIAINVFIPRDMIFIKVASAFAFLVLYLRVQIHLKPWRSPVHYNLEQREIIASIVTLYCAVYFNAEFNMDWSTPIILTICVLINLHFFTMWIFCFMRIPNFSRMPKRLQKYELRYLKYVKVMRFISLTSKTTSLRLKDDPYSTSFASTERITTGFIKQFSTGIANSIYGKRHQSDFNIDKMKEKRQKDVKEERVLKENKTYQKHIKSK